MAGRARRAGLFLSLEGGDGAGKSSQIRRLAEHFRGLGRPVVVTREPGGSPGAEAIRALLVSGAADRWTPLAEALMMYAARAEHLEKVILPALARGDVVITDRFADSTMAYQGVAGDVGEARVKALHALVVGEDEPDLTFILDVPVSVGLARAGKRQEGEGRFESKGASFQERVRQAFLKIAADNPQRCVVVDASGDEAAVFAQMLAVLKERLDARP
jgi:dTMP kinase